MRCHPRESLHRSDGCNPRPIRSRCRACRAGRTHWPEATSPERSAPDTAPQDPRRTDGNRCSSPGPSKSSTRNGRAHPCPHARHTPTPPPTRVGTACRFCATARRHRRGHRSSSRTPRDRVGPAGSRDRAKTHGACPAGGRSRGSRTCGPSSVRCPPRSPRTLPRSPRAVPPRRGPESSPGAVVLRCKAALLPTTASPS